MDSKTFEGEWWVPDTPDDRVPGIVDYSPQEGEAEFFGWLGESHEDGDRQMELDDDGYEEGFIFGETTDADYITIPDVIRVNKGNPDLLSEKGIPTSLYKFSRIYEGGHYAEEPEFEQLTFSLEGLAEWFGDSRIDLELPNDEDGVQSKYIIKETKDYTVQLDTAKLIFVVSCGSSSSQTRTVLEDNVAVNIQLDNPSTFPEIREHYIQPLQRYIALATSVPVQPTSITGIHPEGDRVNIRSNIPNYTPTERSVSRASIFFSTNDVELEDSLQYWFEHEKEAEYLFNFYFGTVYNTQLYLEHQFISLAVGLESYFSHQYPDYQVMDKGEYKKLRQDLVEDIPDDAEAKDRIDNLLTSIGNLPSFRNKLEMVTEEHDEVLEILMDIDGTLSSATDIRHDLAHGLGRDYTSNELANTRYRLQIIIECILLDIAGVDDQSKLEILLGEYHDSQFVDLNRDAIEE